MNDFFDNSWLKITALHLISIFFFLIKWFFHIDLGFYMFSRDLVVVLEWRLVVSSQYDGLVFVVMV